MAGGCSLPAKQSADADPTPSATAGTSTSKKAAPSLRPPPPPPPAPEVDSCRRLAFIDIGRYSNTTPTTPCTKPHTARTFHVATLPGKIAFEGVQVKNEAIQQRAAKSCRSAFVRYIGGDSAIRARIRLTVTYFLPDQAEFDAGAHWVRCDIIALKAERILAELPRKLKGLLDDRESAADEFGLCSTGEPGLEGSRLVMCNQPHTYRAVAALRLGARDDGYPGNKAVSVAGKQRCEDLIVDLLGIDGGFTYTWTYPTALDWDAGQRFGFCWQKRTT